MRRVSDSLLGLYNFPWCKGSSAVQLAAGQIKRITPEEAEHARQQAYSKRPRSPNPTAMPESLQTPPPLKPELDPSAKSWIQIAVGQRGPKDSRIPATSAMSGRNGNSAVGSNGQGNKQQPKQATAGSPGSGVAQVLSVDEERLVDDRAKRPPQVAKGGSRDDNGRSNNGAASNGDGQKQKQAGVSLFGSYKAPIKRG